MICKEKVSLLDAYKIATAAYARAVRELQKNIGTSGRSAYEDLRRIMDDARIQSESSRIELEKHVRAHGC
jgi:hypothetical protein